MRMNCRGGCRVATAVILGIVAFAASLSQGASPSIFERLRTAPKDAGFHMDGYFVWGGSVIRVGDEYHLFASRWPKATGFPQGYRSHSEIVRATSPTPLGPYTFREVVLAGRGGAWWDGKMCHNPKIVKVGDTYVLYYIGSARDSGLRKCGYAFAKSIEGSWSRREQPLPFGEDHNNPAPYIHQDGRVLIAFRDRDLNMYIATADAFDGRYEIAARNLFPFKIEDPDLFFCDGWYHMVVEDNAGSLTGHVRHGGHLVSLDGLRWQPADPVRIYDHTLRWTDGTTAEADRRERPELFNAEADRKGNGPPTHLLTAVQVGDDTWCHIQPIAPATASDR